MSWVMRRQLVMVGLVVLLTSVVTVTASQSSAVSQVDIVILGGPGAVSATVEARLKTCTTGSVSRVAGSNRYETAATISAASFSSSEGAYIATGLNFPDGLAGGPSAALDRQPVLLVNDAIPAATRTELGRLGVSRVTVLGGPGAVPDGVVASLNALVPTTRIAGSDRYSTAAAIAQDAFPSADTVYVATGMDFPDALAGVPAAAGDAAPILLVRQNSVPASTAAQLIRLKPTTIKILGGEAAVSAGVAAGLGNYASNVVRFAGSDRYATAVAISKHAFPNSASRIYVATGLDYPDVLAGGPAAAVNDGPILLVKPSAIPNATKAEIQRITGTTCAPTTTTIAGTSLGAAPSYLNTVLDPLYGAYLTRVTDFGSGPIGDTGRTWDDSVRYRHHFSSVQAWNADGSVLYLARGTLFVDGSTYEPLNLKAPPGLINWSTTDPDIMLATQGSNIVLWNVWTGSIERTIPLAGYDTLSFQPRTSPSNDGSRVGVKARRQNDGEWVCLGVDLVAGQIGQVVSFDRWNFSLGAFSEYKARRCGVSPSGRYLFLDGYANGSFNDQAHFFDWNTGTLVHKQRDNQGIECPGGHGDLGLDSSGRDVFVGVCKGGGESWSDSLKWQTVELRIEDGNIRGVGPSFSHTTCRNTARPGWCYGSSFGSNPIIAAFSLDGRSREYYADPQVGPDDDYWDEPHAVPSPDGRKILFASSWRGTWSEPATLVLDVSRLR